MADMRPRWEDDGVFLRGIELSLIIGIHPHEQTKRQKVSVSLTLYKDLHPAAESHVIGETIDYEWVHRRILELETGPPIKLVETLAEQVAAIALAETDCTAVAVEVIKDKILPKVAATGVKIFRKRLS